MKQILLMGSGVMILVLTSLILITLQGRQIRQTKLNNGLSELMEEYMEGAYADLELKNLSDEECLKWFEKHLKERINEDAAFEVTILSRDMNEGILSLEIVETYEHINGDEGVLKEKNTVVVEADDTKETYEVFYCLSKDMAKEYRLPVLIRKYVFPIGASINCPKAPELEGKRFLCWREEKTNNIYSQEELEDYRITKNNQVFIAVYE